MSKVLSAIRVKLVLGANEHGTWFGGLWNATLNNKTINETSSLNIHLTWANIALPMLKEMQSYGVRICVYNFAALAFEIMRNNFCWVKRSSRQLIHTTLSSIKSA